MTDAQRIADALNSAVKGFFPEGVTGSCYITTREAWYKAMEAIREQAALVVERELPGDVGKRVADKIRRQ